MDAAQALRSVVEASGLTHRQIEARAGRYGGWVGQTLARPKPGADLLAEIARSCGYRLDLVPIDGGVTITIGDACDDAGDAATIGQARAILARATAILDSIDQGDA
jgi:hypothetical protein